MDRAGLITIVKIFHLEGFEWQPWYCTICTQNEELYFLLVRVLYIVDFYNFCHQGLPVPQSSFFYNWAIQTFFLLMMQLPFKLKVDFATQLVWNISVLLKFNIFFYISLIAKR